MKAKPTNESGASAEVTDAYGTRYVKDAGTGQLHRIGPKRPNRLLLVAALGATALAERDAQDNQSILDLISEGGPNGE